MKIHSCYRSFLIILICALHGYGREVDINYITQLRLANPPIAFDALPRSDQNYTLDEIVNTLKRRDASEWTYGSLLMRLKEASIIKKYAELYNQSNGQNRTAYRAIEESRSPWMIPEVINVLLTGKSAIDYLGGDQIRYGPAADTRILITKILATSPEFSNEVRTWAKANLSIWEIQEQNELVDIMRKWWKMNEVHFQAESFDKVQIPASLPPKQPAQQFTAKPATIQPTPEPVAPAPPEATPEPVKSSVAASMLTPAAAPEPAAKTNPVWWIVGLIILAAGVVFVMRKKKPKA